MTEMSTDTMLSPSLSSQSANTPNHETTTTVDTRVYLSGTPDESAIHETARIQTWQPAAEGCRRSQAAGMGSANEARNVHIACVRAWTMRASTMQGLCVLASVHMAEWSPSMHSGKTS